MENVNGEGTKFRYTVSCISTKFVRCPTVLLFLVWHSWITCHWVYCICNDQDFDSITRLNWITEMCHFPTCLQADAHEMTCQHSIFKQSILHGISCGVWKGGSEISFYYVSFVSQKMFNIQNYFNHWSFAYLSTFMWKILPVCFSHMQGQWLWEHYWIIFKVRNLQFC